MSNPKKSQTFFDARGRLLLERRGLPRNFRDSLSKDAYHFMRTSSWTSIILGFAALFLVVNLLFAIVLYVGHAQIANAHGFLDCFWFSVQTMGTIGYGVLAPDDTLSNVVVTLESFVSIGLTALITGVFFSRFATPSARVIFSKVAIIATYDGQRTLMFRMANARATAIVEATCHVYVSRDEVTSDGERVRRIHDLPLRRTTTPIFNLSWTAYHAIDPQSPLYGKSLDDIRDSGTNIIVTFQGIDDQLAATVHTRYAYNFDDLHFDCRFTDIFRIDPATKKRYLDFTHFDDTEPLAAAASVAAG